MVKNVSVYFSHHAREILSTVEILVYRSMYQLFHALLIAHLSVPHFQPCEVLLDCFYGTWSGIGARLKLSVVTSFVLRLEPDESHKRLQNVVAIFMHCCCQQVFSSGSRDVVMSPTFEMLESNFKLPAKSSAANNISLSDQFASALKLLRS